MTITDTGLSNLYAWLIREAAKGADGALADPMRGELLDDSDGRLSYGFTAAVYKGRVSYSVRAGKTPKDAACDAVMAECKEKALAARAEVLDVYKRFRADHPEVFWLSGESVAGHKLQYTYRDSSKAAAAEYTMKIYLQLYDGGAHGAPTFDAREEDYRSTAAIRRDIAVRDQRIAQIVSHADVKYAMGDAGRVQALNRILTAGNCYYSGNMNSVPPYSRTCLPALIGSEGRRGAVCAGYAKAFKVLCDRLAIPCVTVSGDGYSRNSRHAEPHMWNAVRISGEWYGVDVTWNDPTVDGINSVNTGYESEEYLLVGSDTLIGGRTFAQSHVPDRKDVAAGMVPTLSRSAYGGITKRI